MENMRKFFYPELHFEVKKRKLLKRILTKNTNLRQKKFFERRIGILINVKWLCH